MAFLTTYLALQNWSRPHPKLPQKAPVEQIKWTASEVSMYQNCALVWSSTEGEVRNNYVPKQNQPWENHKKGNAQISQCNSHMHAQKLTISCEVQEVPGKIRAMTSTKTSKDYSSLGSFSSTPALLLAHHLRTWMSLINDTAKTEGFWWMGTGIWPYGTIMMQLWRQTDIMMVSYRNRIHDSQLKTSDGSGGKQIFLCLI